jgi:hypothetical protein
MQRLYESASCERGTEKVELTDSMRDNDNSHHFL